MKTFVSSALLIVMSSAVFAQPAQPAQPPQVAQAAAPATEPAALSPAPMAPVAQAQVRLQLSAEDQELLSQGSISTGEHIGGGVAALFLGFGIGHAVQGRWMDRGWIFTLGETASVGLVIYGMSRAASCTSLDESGTGGCASNGLGLVAGGAVALTALHLWETIDAFVAPVGHNRRVRAAQVRAGMRPMYSTITPYVTPVQAGDGAMGGLSLRF